MSKDFTLLDWEGLKGRLLPYLKTEASKIKLVDLQPTFSQEESKRLREESAFLWNLFEKGKGIELPSLPSLQKIFDGAQKRGFLLPGEVFQIGLWIMTSLELRDILKNSPFLSLSRLSDELSLLLERIKELFDLERKEIKDSASYQLRIIRRKKRLLEEEIFLKLEDLKDKYYKLGYLQEPIYLQREGRYVLPVKPEYKNKVKGILQGLSQSGATVFVEPFSLIHMTNELEELVWQEEREVSRILKELTEELFSFQESFFKLEEFMVSLDLAIARVELGRTYRGILPDEEKASELFIEEGFHPSLFFRAQEKEKPYPVTNNYLLREALMITGPNLGGKTVTLKTIGISVLMAQNGFLLPAKKAQIPYFKKLLVDLGDEQNLWEGESSFSAHLKNLKRILDLADKESLVLLDEPGRGTNPEEGALLVWAIIEGILEKGAKVIMTTHSHILKVLASQRKEFSFATVEFNRKTFSPTYRLLYNYLGDSHAFELARRVGLSESLIKRARDLLLDKDYFNLQDRYAQNIEAIENLKKDWEEKVRLLKEEREELSKFKKELEKKYERAMEKLFGEWQREFRTFLEQLASAKSSKRAHREFQKFLEERHLPRIFEERSFQEGEKVFVKCFGKEGTILKIKDKTALVLSGQMKLEVPLQELRREDIKNPPKPRYSATLSHPPSCSKEKIHLLGEEVESALNLLERKLNRCFLEGKDQLLVIHGHGTGKLRQAIRDYLKVHPLVKAYEEAPSYEGGSGATLVYLHKKN
ncbi:endonuclease MutS2 [Caldimicrobium thiodismutans]|uniref:endonuclease MutS2 n=1 Tax=Caldimicrobium thiodismutans TaxID=1653476 RepID=UPI000838AF52